ncbi:bL35 family ribosomal protein, partial [Francisella tularensis]
MTLSLSCHFSAAKRFKKTGKGGFKHRCANRAHINT